MADQIAAPGTAAQSAAAAALAPDPELAEILRKHAAGEKLVPREFGRLGAWRFKLKQMAGGTPKVAPVPPARPDSIFRPASAGTPTPGASQVPGLGRAPLDPDLVRRTTEAILKTCDGLARTWIISEARKAGADEISARAFEQAAALQSGPKDLMIQTSPEVIAALGIDSSNYPVAAFLTGASIWAGSVLMAVNQLKRLQLERAKRDKSAAAAAASPSVPANDSPQPRQ